jgi:hypothetical protein
MGAPAQIRLGDPRSDLTLQEIASDSEWRRYFGALADHYSRILWDTIADARLVADLGNVLYLIDVDVVRNLTELRFKDNRIHRESVRLFQNDQFEFALPLGAFQELLEWLRGIVPNKITWSEDTTNRNLSPEDTVRHLAAAFDLQGTDADPLDVVERITYQVEAQKPIIERLFEFLTRPNFKGVVADYQLEDADILTSMLGRMNRADTDRIETRPRRDYRDAVNLAVVCQNSRERNERKSRKKENETPSYILVTQTHLLLDFAKTLFNQVDDSSKTFSSLLGLRNMAPPGLYPCMSPRRAFIVEEVRRRSGLSRVSLKTLGSERQNYQDLADALRSIDDESSTDTEGLSIQKTADTLNKHLSYLVEVYHRSDSVFRVLERDRVWEASLRRFEEKHRGEGTPGKTKLKRFKLETESFFKVLYRLQQLVAKLSPISYQTKKETDETGTLESITIYAKKVGDMVMQGEVYRSACPDGAQEGQAYSFRWPTGCNDQQFLAAVRSIVDTNRQLMTSEKDLRLVRISGPQDVQEGFVVFTNLGAYRSDDERVAQRLSPRQLSLDSIRRALRALFSPEVTKIVIVAVRVCTSFGDFQVDFEGDGSGEREVFVISHLDIAEQIAHLCEATHMYAVIPVKLHEALKEVTSQFPRYIPGQ